MRPGADKIRMTKPLLQAGLFLLLASILIGCGTGGWSTKASTHDLRRLQAGMTVAQVQKTLRATGAPQFRVFGQPHREGRRFHIGRDGRSYDLVFANDRLSAVYPTPAHPTRRENHLGTPWDVMVREDPWKRLARLGRQPDRLHDIDRLAAELIQPSSRSSDPAAILPAFALAAPAYAIASPVIAIQAIDYHGGVRKWNVDRVDPADNLASLTSKFGPPLAQRGSDVHFGPAGSLAQNAATAPMRLLVVMRNGRAHAAFGDDFYRDPP